MKREKLIIICVAILAVAVVWSQISKQNSIERQAQMKIDQENKVIQLEQDEKDAAASAERIKKAMINLCVADAEKDYWSFMELNGTKKDDGSITALTRFWDQAAENKKDDIDLCYRKYE